MRSVQISTSAADSPPKDEKIVRNENPFIIFLTPLSTAFSLEMMYRDLSWHETIKPIAKVDQPLTRFAGPPLQLFAMRCDCCSFFLGAFSCPSPHSPNAARSH